MVAEVASKKVEKSTFLGQEKAEFHFSENE
jgi:hypothetical protein